MAGEKQTTGISVEQLKNLFDVDMQNDLAVGYLRDIFGSVVDIAAGAPIQNSAPNVIETAMGLFNSGVLFLGAIYLGYIAVVGSLHTAERGTTFGGRWSPVWVPVRAIIGTGALLPVAGGWNLLQVLVFWLLLQGIGLANNIYFAVVEQVDKSGVIVSTNALPDTRELALNVLASEQCLIIVQKVFDAADNPYKDRLQIFQEPIIDDALKIPTGTRIAWGVPRLTNGESQEYHDNLCGEVIVKADGTRVAKWRDAVSRLTAAQEITEDVNPSGRGIPQFRTTTIPGKSVDKALALTLQNLDRTLLAAHQGATAQLIQDMRGVAQALTFTAETQAAEGRIDLRQIYGGVVGAVEAGANRYTATIARAARSVLKIQGKSVWDAFVSDMRRDGFLFAGSWYYAASDLNGQIVAAIQSLPTSSGYSLQEAEKRGLGIFESQDLSSWFGQIEKIRFELAQRPRRNPIAFTGEKQNATSDDFTSPSGRFAAPAAVGGSGVGIGNSIFDKAIDALRGNRPITILDDPSVSPIVAVKQLGDEIVNWISTGVVAVVGVLAGGSWLSNTIVGDALGLDGAAQTVSAFAMPLITFLAGAFFIAGLTLSIYVPLIPYIVWAGAVLAFFLLAIEALIAAPIWAVAFLEPGGDGPGGKGAQGWYLVLGLFLRPSLMIFGLLTCMVLSSAIVGFVNLTFGNALNSVTGAGYAGLLRTAAYLVIYTGLIVTLIHASYSLIHIIPDRIMRWIGAGQEQLGELGVERQSAGIAAAGAAGVVAGHHAADEAVLGASGAHSGGHSGGHGGDHGRGSHRGSGRGGSHRAGGAKLQAGPDAAGPGKTKSSSGGRGRATSDVGNTGAGQGGGRGFDSVFSDNNTGEKS